MLAAVEAEAPGVADASNLDVAGIAGRLDAIRVGAERGSPSGRRRFVVQSFVWPYVVVGIAKAVEDALLQIEVGCWRSSTRPTRSGLGPWTRR